MDSDTHQQNQVTFDQTNVKEDHSSKVEGFGSSSVRPVIYCQGLGLGLETPNSISNNWGKFRVSIIVLWPEFLNIAGAAVEAAAAAVAAAHTVHIGTL